MGLKNCHLWAFVSAVKLELNLEEKCNILVNQLQQQLIYLHLLISTYRYLRR